jgi:hypothetical protein
MKKVFLSVLTVVLAFTVTAQQVPRQSVILETLTDATG